MLHKTQIQILKNQALILETLQELLRDDDGSITIRHQLSSEIDKQINETSKLIKS